MELIQQEKITNINFICSKTNHEKWQVKGGRFLLIWYFLLAVNVISSANKHAMTLFINKRKAAR